VDVVAFTYGASDGSQAQAEGDRVPRFGAIDTSTGNVVVRDPVRTRINTVTNVGQASAGSPYYITGASFASIADQFFTSLYFSQPIGSAGTLVGQLDLDSDRSLDTGDIPMRGAIQDGTGVPSFGGDTSLWFRLGGIEGALIHLEHDQSYDPFDDPDAVFGGQDNDGRWVISGNTLTLATSISTFDPFRIAFQGTNEVSLRLSTDNQGDMYARCTLTDELGTVTYDSLPRGLGVVDTATGQVIAPLALDQNQKQWVTPLPLGNLPATDFIEVDAEVVGGNLVVKGVLRQLPVDDTSIDYWILLDTDNNPNFGKVINGKVTADYVVTITTELGQSAFIRTASIRNPDGTTVSHDTWINVQAQAIESPLPGSFTVTIPLNELKSVGPQLRLLVASVVDPLYTAGFIVPQDMAPYSIAPNGMVTYFPLTIPTGGNSATMQISSAMPTETNSGTGSDNISVSQQAANLLRVTDKNAAFNAADTSASDSATTSGTPISSSGQKINSVPAQVSGDTVAVSDGAPLVNLDAMTQAVVARSQDSGKILSANTSPQTSSVAPTEGTSGTKAARIPLNPAASNVTLVSPTTLTYQDVDGDIVTVRFSKPVLTSTALASAVFHFDTGSVNGNDTAGQQLQTIDLTQLPTIGGTSVASGISLTITARRSKAGGDGLVDVGFINATGIDLGAVLVEGDLGRIDAGDANTATAGLQSLTVQSLGQLGTTTQASGGSLESDILGPLGSLAVQTNVVGALVQASGGTNGVDGKIGTIFVGGSLIGDKGDNSGSIFSTGDMGPVTIQGDVRGGAGSDSGQVLSGGTLAGVIVGGSLIGGSGFSSGAISSLVNMGPVTIHGDVQGGASTGSGIILSGGTLAGAIVGGALVGGSGNLSGSVSSLGDMGSVTIHRDVSGGDGIGAGLILSGGTLAGVTVGGSLIGGSGNASGMIFSLVNMGPVTIHGDVQGGTGFYHLGQIFSGGTLAGVTVDGALIGGTGTSSGAIASLRDMGPVDIHDDVRGGAGTGSGLILSGGKLAGVTVDGALLGGKGNASGLVFSIGDMGPVMIHGDARGGDGNSSGEIFSGGTLASVTVGGALVGGSSTHSGSIISLGAMGPVAIHDDLSGGAGNSSGEIFSNATLAGVTVDGALIGGTGTSSGSISSRGDMGSVDIHGDVLGGDGSDPFGQIASGGTLKSVSVGGSLLGGTGDSSGTIFSLVNMGPVKIHGDVLGGAGADSGQVFSEGTVAGVTMGGSLVGGTGDSSGTIFSLGDMGPVTIRGDVLGGSVSGTASLTNSGAILSFGRIDRVTIGGSVIAGRNTGAGTLTNSGAIRAAFDLGPISVGGSLVGNRTNLVVISARGPAKVPPGATTDVAIDSLNVRGGVQFTNILAGYDIFGTPVNAAAQIGKVRVGGTWVASNLVAGAVSGPNGFGSGDTLIGTSDVPGVHSQIGPIVIRGQVVGDVSSDKHYGFVAEEVVSLTVGHTPISLKPGINNDYLVPVDKAGKVTVNEV